MKNYNKTISIEPNQSSLEVDFQLEYKNKVIGNQRNNVNFAKDSLEIFLIQELSVYLKI